MTQPLPRPPKKDPQKRTNLPAMPPTPRSRQAFAFSAYAAEGRLALQQCNACGKLTYPARDACPSCLSVDLAWCDVPAGGSVLAETTIRTSTNTYFRERTPWRAGLVALDCGVTLVAHIHGDVAEVGRVRIVARTDRSGQGIVIALPEKDSEHMEDDRQWREVTADPKHRRVLVTDGRTPLGQAMAAALAKAGAASIFVGLSETWRPFEGEAALKALPNVEPFDLDVTDTDSVRELAGEIGGKTDILINTAEHVRPGGPMDRDGVTTARDEMEVNYFGLWRLIQAFGPAMKFRGADGDNRAAAFVNLFPVDALLPSKAFGGADASHAAALALTHTLRADMAGSGVKVVNVFTGPLEEPWRQLLPPPKVTPAHAASATIRALQEGLEEVTVGAVADDLYQRWRADPSALARETLQTDPGP
ncbi:MAG: SDR family NAD(P)-dependent oxidoreductase [Pseudomonadota bacterium]